MSESITRVKLEILARKSWQTSTDTHTQTGHTRKTHEAHKYFFVLDIINTI